MTRIEGTKPEEIRALKRKARVVLSLFVAGLVLAGLSALPIRTGTEFLQRLVGEGSPTESWWPGLAAWISQVHRGVTTAGREYPFLFYGTDWLAFGHFVIAIAFLGALRDPVRNVWVIEFGLIACVLVIPWALLFGPLRGIPFFWRLIDCSFGVIGILPLLLAGRYARQIMRLQKQQPMNL
jgi:hypothetical protein